MQCTHQTYPAQSALPKWNIFTKYYQVHTILCRVHIRLTQNSLLLPSSYQVEYIFTKYHQVHTILCRVHIRLTQHSLLSPSSYQTQYLLTKYYQAHTILCRVHISLTQHNLLCSGSSTGAGDALQGCCGVGPGCAVIKHTTQSGQL